MKSKYHAKKVTVDGITFDSRKEADRYKELLLLERAGKICDLQRQVKFVLIPTQRGAVWNDKKHKFDRPVIERSCTYIADFVYHEYINEDTMQRVVEDVKGFKTKEYIIKRKLMLYLNGLEIREV